MRVEVFITGLVVGLVSAALLCASSIPEKASQPAPKPILQQQSQIEPDPYAGMSDSERMRGIILEPVEK